MRTALSLVGYQKDVSKAIEFVFGDTLICDDAAAARDVTFNETVKVRSVTLDGDTYDPSGTLSGGAKADASDVLVRIQRVVEIEQTLAAAHERLQKLVQEEARTKGVRERWQQLGQDLDLKQHELTLLEAQVGGSTASLVRHFLCFASHAKSVGRKDRVYIGRMGSASAAGSQCPRALLLGLLS